MHTILTVLLAGISIAVTYMFVMAPHEVGHLLAAKVLGVKAQELGLGVGPVGVALTWRGTTYSLRLVPLGAFVRFGDDYSTIAPWRRLLVSAAGPAASLVAAFVFYGMAAMLVRGVGAGMANAVHAAGVSATFVASHMSIFADPSNYAGPVGAAQYVVHYTSQGWVIWLLLLSYFSASIAILNLLPIGPLDGGGIVMASIEIAARRRLPRVTIAYKVAGWLVLVVALCYVTAGDVLRMVGR